MPTTLGQPEKNFCQPNWKTLLVLLDFDMNLPLHSWRSPFFQNPHISSVSKFEGPKFNIYSCVHIHLNLLAGPGVLQKLTLRMELIIYFWHGCVCAVCNAQRLVLLLVYHVEASISQLIFLDIFASLCRSQWKQLIDALLY